MGSTKSLDPIALSIRRIIKRKGLVQGFVAKKAGFTIQQFSDMLNDRRIIRAVDLLQIADALGVQVQEIYDAGIGDEEQEDEETILNAQ
jgi:transcriptional regulator with XRE-family HTH domain